MDYKVHSAIIAEKYTTSTCTAMILISVNNDLTRYVFFLWQRGDGDICLKKPKDKESKQWMQFHL